MEPRAPSGLFPVGPSRPRFREPHPIRLALMLSGVALAATWLLVFGLLATSTRGYIWWTIIAGAAAWLAALALGRFGDRGAATGVAITTGAGVAVAFAVAVYEWVTVGWPLW